MKANRKRLLSLLLVAVMLFGMLPTVSFADSQKEYRIDVKCNADSPKVTLYDADGKEIPLGWGKAYHLPAGTYAYTAEAEGYASQVMVPFTVADGGERQVLSITLTPGGTQDPDVQNTTGGEGGGLDLSGIGLGGGTGVVTSPVSGGIFDARFGRHQVFEVYRVPAYPEGTQAEPKPYTVMDLKIPSLPMPAPKVDPDAEKDADAEDEEEPEEGYYYFVALGKASETGVSFSKLWRADDEKLDPYTVALYAARGDKSIHVANGVIGALSAEGFLFEGGGKVVWFSNAQGYPFVDPYCATSITYTPDVNGRLVCDLSLLTGYAANSMLRGTKVHEHKWNVKFEEDSNTVSYWCEAEGCPHGTAVPYTFTINAPKGRGAQAEVEKTGDGEWPAELEEGIVQYTGRGDTEYKTSVNPPKADGTYTAQVTVGYRTMVKTIKVDYAIGVAEPYVWTETVNGVQVTVEADAGVFADNAELRVTEATVDEAVVAAARPQAQDATPAEEAAEAAATETEAAAADAEAAAADTAAATETEAAPAATVEQKVVSSTALRVQVTDENGAVLQPLGEGSVKVSLSYKETEENQTVSFYSITADEAGAMTAALLTADEDGVVSTAVDAAVDLTYAVEVVSTEVKEATVPGEYTASVEGIVEVKAEVPPEAFDREVKLSVAASDELNQDAAEMLDANGKTYDGHLAFDIGFVALNEDGSVAGTIEPTLGEGEKVSVSMTLLETALAQLPDDINVNSLKLYHMVPSVGLQLVADAGSLTGGMVNAEKQEAPAAAEESAQKEAAAQTEVAPLETKSRKLMTRGASALPAVPEAKEANTEEAAKAAITALTASFDVTSFSTFILTWGEDQSAAIHWGYGDVQADESHSLEHEFDAAILDTHAASISLANTYDGYNFVGAYYIDNGVETDIDPVLIRVEDGWQCTATIHHEDESTTTETRLIPDGSDIYVIYVEKSGSGYKPNPDEEMRPEVEKTVTANSDGTQTIRLEVTAPVKQDVQQTGANVLLILDTTYSMASSMTGATNRFEAARSAMLTLIDALDCGTNDIDLALVEFNSTGSIVRNWTKDYTSFRNYIATGTQHASGPTGTNWQSGLYYGLNVLGSADTDATYVIFLSDGEPNRRGDTTSTNCGAAQGVQSAQPYANSIAQSSYLYGVFCGSATGADRMNTLIDTATGSTDTVIVATDRAAIDEAFNNIASTIISHLGSSNYSLDDGIPTLSGISAAAMVSGGDVSGFTYEIKGPDDTGFSTWSDAPGASYSADNGVTWDLSKAGTLASGTTYALEFTVWPSQEAYDLISKLNNRTVK